MDGNALGPSGVAVVAAALRGNVARASSLAAAAEAGDGVLEVNRALFGSDAIDRIGLSSDSSDSDNEYLAGVDNTQREAEQNVTTEKTLAVLSALAGVDIGATRRLRETLTPGFAFVTVDESELCSATATAVVKLCRHLGGPRFGFHPPGKIASRVGELHHT